jgi:hypothetical protein
MPNRRFAIGWILATLVAHVCVINLYGFKATLFPAGPRALEVYEHGLPLPYTIRVRVIKSNPWTYKRNDIVEFRFWAILLNVLIGGLFVALLGIGMFFSKAFEGQLTFSISSQFIFLAICALGCVVWKLAPATREPMILCFPLIALVGTAACCTALSRYRRGAK